MMGFGLVWVVLIVVGIFALIRNGAGWDVFQGTSDRHRVEDPGPASAGEILARRYARGELTREEFRRMKEDLEDV